MKYHNAKIPGLKFIPIHNWFVLFIADGGRRRELDVGKGALFKHRADDGRCCERSTVQARGQLTLFLYNWGRRVEHDL